MVKSVEVTLGHILNLEKVNGNAIETSPKGLASHLSLQIYITSHRSKRNILKPFLKFNFRGACTNATGDRGGALLFSYFRL